MGTTVGILGLAGSGKDTFAKMLQEELQKLGHTFVLRRYAQPLKELTARIYGLTIEELEDRVIKEKPVQVPRDVMLDRVFECLVDVLEFDNDELDKASELYFEHFSSAKATSPREFQQVFGTDVVRAVRSNAWVEYLHSKEGKFIVTDVRFDNEFCDYNFLLQRHTAITRPVHASEHLAWDLEYKDGCWLEYDESIEQIHNYTTGWTLDDLKYQAKQVARRYNNKL